MISEVDGAVHQMFLLAEQAMKMAYAPYSNFTVGACIRTPDNQFFSGCNIENSQFGLCQCAEASAIAQMVLAGFQAVQEVLVVGNSLTLCTPCGACRQKLMEFANEETLVHLCNYQREHRAHKLSELLPLAFTKNNWRSQ